MNIAITLNPEVPPETLLEIVQLAEALGFSHCYLGDEGFIRDIYVILASLARVTKQIQLGPGITNPYTRHPVVTAAAIASLDELSGGRAFLGFGAGGSMVLEPMGLARVSPLTACREAMEIIRLLWQGEPVNYQGQHFQLKEAQLQFAVRPELELHWAARGPKMLALGGELANVIMLHGIPFFELAEVVAIARQAAHQAGRTVRLQYAVPLVYDKASLEGIRVRTAYRLVDSTEPVRKRIGITPELYNELRYLVTTKGAKAAARLVSDDVLSHYTLQGDVKSCAASLRELVRTYGLDGLTFSISDFSKAQELLKYAADIIAHL